MLGENNEADAKKRKIVMSFVMRAYLSSHCVKETRSKEQLWDFHSPNSRGSPPIDFCNVRVPHQNTPSRIHAPRRVEGVANAILLGWRAKTEACILPSILQG
jgi:hypothetical protein